MEAVLRRPIEESVIDFPKPELDLSFWDKRADGTYTIKPSAKKKILSTLGKYKPLDLHSIAKEIHITGSMGTNQFLDDCDVDVHVIPDVYRLPGEKTPLEWQKSIFKFYKDNREYIGQHPVEVYLQLNPTQELMADASYDLLDDRWIKGPKFVSQEFDPYEVYRSVVDDVKNIAADADRLFGELKRDVIDYLYIKQVMAELSPNEKQRLKGRLESKLKELEDDVERLMANKKEWIQARRTASRPETPKQALKDIELAKKWSNTNALFKLLNRYQYLRLIEVLEQMMEDEKLDQREIEMLRDLLGVMR